MFGIDTNMLLRLFAPSDNPRQTAAVRDFIRANAPVFISSIVLAEFVWTLRRSFGLGHGAVVALLARMVAAPEFAMAEPDATRRAVERYKNGAADFSDYLIGELNSAAGCRTTMTFDRAAARTSAFQLLKS
jgi:predicted nucleic-acid-binding protein